MNGNKNLHQKLNERPIIGVALVKTDKTNLGIYCVPTSYTKSLEASGARVVPVFPNQSMKYYRKMFEKLNGLLVPGGVSSPLDDQKPVTEMVKLFYDWSIEAYNNKEHPVYWPIWGTCLGFEILVTISAGMVHCLEPNHLCKSSRVLNLKPGYEKARVIRNIPSDLVKAMSAEPLLPHVHRFCLTYDKFRQCKLDNFYWVIGTNTHDTGVEYVTAVEAHEYPIYAFMGHQEKSIYHWSALIQYNKSSNAIKLAQSMMNFFVDECRKNNHRFASIEEENMHVFQNYTPTFTAPMGNLDDETYYFRESDLQKSKL